MNYYIFRHGETFFSKTKLPYGPFENVASILPSGIPAIKKIAKYLKKVSPDKNFSSPYPRCKQTVKIIEKQNKSTFLYDKRLGEFRNETVREMEARLKDFLKEIESKNYENVAICSHGWPIACLVDIILKEKLEFEDLRKYPPCGVLVTIKGKKLKEINFN